MGSLTDSSIIPSFCSIIKDAMNLIPEDLVDVLRLCKADSGVDLDIFAFLALKEASFAHSVNNVKGISNLPSYKDYLFLPQDYTATLPESNKEMFDVILECGNTAMKLDMTLNMLFNTIHNYQEIIDTLNNIKILEVLNKDKNGLGDELILEAHLNKIEKKHRIINQKTRRIVRVISKSDINDNLDFDSDADSENSDASENNFNKPSLNLEKLIKAIPILKSIEDNLQKFISRLIRLFFDSVYTIKACKSSIDNVLKLNDKWIEKPLIVESIRNIDTKKINDTHLSEGIILEHEVTGEKLSWVDNDIEPVNEVLSKDIEKLHINPVDSDDKLEFSSLISNTHQDEEMFEETEEDVKYIYRRKQRQRHLETIRIRRLTGQRLAKAVAYHISERCDVVLQSLIIDMGVENQPTIGLDSYFKTLRINAGELHRTPWSSVIGGLASGRFHGHF